MLLRLLSTPLDLHDVEAIMNTVISAAVVSSSYLDSTSTHALSLVEVTNINDGLILAEEAFL